MAFLYISLVLLYYFFLVEKYIQGNVIATANQQNNRTIHKVTQCNETVKKTTTYSDEMITNKRFHLN